MGSLGFALPPIVIRDRKHPASELAVGEIPDTIYGLPAIEWIDHKLDILFNNHSLQCELSAKPLLLIMNRHSSHYCPDSIKQAAEQHILFTLLPNRTYLLQPLDKGCFGS